MIRQRLFEKRYILTTAVVSLLTALAVFLPAIIKDRGFFLIVDDFNAQQLTFSTAVRYALASRPVGDWFWGIDLGTSLVNTFGFYNLGSPFFWITLLFPQVEFPYLAGWLYIVKYVVAAITAHLYLRRFLKDEKYAVIGALLYAFSGFQATNLLFFHFHDVTAFFPLLLLGLEKVMEDRRYRPHFIFAVFLNCLVNYFFFVGEVVFLALYFVIRFTGLPLKAFLKAVLNRLLDGALGVCMAMILFLPSVLYVFGNTRSEFSLTAESAFYGLKEILLILKGLLLPGDLMNDASAVTMMNYNSTAAYLPVFGLSFVFAYLFRKPDRLSVILLLSLVISFFPCLQAGFYLFSSVYQRWWYMALLLFALATAKVLERPESYRIGLGVLVHGVLIAALYLVVRFLYRNEAGGLTVLHGKRFLAQALIAALPPFLVWFFLKRRFFGWKCVALATALCCCATSAMTLYQYRKLNTNLIFPNVFKAGTRMEAIDDQYRYRATGILMTMNGRSAAYIGFCSTLENSSYAFNRLFGLNSPNFTRDRAKIRGVPSLLGAKFRMTTEPGENDNAVPYLVDRGTVYYLITYEYTCPIGFSLDRYQTVKQLKKLPVDERACALMHAFVIDRDQIGSVKALAKPFDAKSVDLKDGLISAIETCKQNAVVDFQRDNTGFRCRTVYDTDRFVYFTVPYDEGWQATVDGAPAEILNSGGMMLIAVPAGEHAVSFVYHTPGLRAGAVVTAGAWLLFAGLCFASCVRRRRGGGEGETADPKKCAIPEKND